MIDIVITHINFNDINWQNQYKQYFKEFNYNRHRAEINFKYLLRSINDNIDFVNNVYLIVSSETQVYDWINKDKVKIILHKDIIPQEFLPTFNSCTIEMFLHKIPNLSDKFIYFNDDMFIMSKKQTNDYYDNGKSNIGLIENGCSYKQLTTHQYINDLTMIQKLTNKIYSKGVNRLQSLHIPILFFKEDCDFVYDNLKNEIHKRISKMRTKHNNSQYLFMDYMVLNNHWIAPPDTYNHHKYIKINTEKDLEQLKEIIFNPNIKDLCVNYVAEEFIPAVNNLFEQKFPNKSIYEI